MCFQGAGRRNPGGALLRGARHRADRAPRRLHRFLGVVLREGNRAIVRPASKASKATDLLLGFLPADKQTVATTSRDDGDEVTAVT